MTKRGGVTDKWHRRCDCGYVAHINNLGECPKCGESGGWSR